MKTVHLTAEYFLDLLKEVKLFHWFTENYEMHLISDGLHSALSSSFDKIAESLIGHSGYSPPRPPTIARGDTVFQNLLKCEVFLKKIQCPRARASVDDALESIGKFMYLSQLARAPRDARR